jgi:hypothetical protein
MTIEKSKTEELKKKINKQVENAKMITLLFKKDKKQIEVYYGNKLIAIRKYDNEDIANNNYEALEETIKELKFRAKGKDIIFDWRYSSYGVISKTYTITEEAYYKNYKNFITDYMVIVCETKITDVGQVIEFTVLTNAEEERIRKIAEEILRG